MQTFYKNKEKIKEEEEQCKLITSLTSSFYRKYNLSKYFYNSDLIDCYNEFISIVFWYVYTRDIFNKFDKVRASFSTFFIMILKQNFKIFIMMINLNCDYLKAKQFCMIKSNKNLTEEQKEKLISYKFSTVSLLSLNIKLNKEDEDDIEIIDNLVDDTVNIERIIEIKEEYKKFNKWLDNTKSFNKKRKDIIKSYMRNPNTTQIAKEYNCSRQNISWVIQRVKQLYKHNVDI